MPPTEADSQETLARRERRLALRIIRDDQEYPAAVSPASDVWAQHYATAERRAAERLKDERRRTLAAARTVQVVFALAAVIIGALCFVLSL
jgi:hypothetical protein